MTWALLASSDGQSGTCLASALVSTSAPLLGAHEGDVQRILPLGHQQPARQCSDGGTDD